MRYLRSGGMGYSGNHPVMNARVLALWSALIAATEIGRPRMDPELSISRLTTVSRKSVSLSTLKERG